MDLLAELTLFSRLLGAIVGGVFLCALFFFGCGFIPVTLLGFDLWIPVFTSDSLSVSTIGRFAEDLLPATVTLVAPSPLSAFSAQIAISFFLAVLFLMPLSLLALFVYLVPALAPRERLSLGVTCLLGIILFFLGICFGYFIVVPQMFALLAGYAALLAIPNYFFIGEFITTSATLLVLCGFIFLIPVCMPLLTRLGLVGASSWRSYWRFFVVASLVVTAVLSVDGSGITMFLLSTPLIACYGLGCLFAFFVEWLEKKGE